MFGLRVEQPPPVDVFYTPGEAIAFGTLEARWHHTPGHCPGGVCLGSRRKAGARGADLFVGDTLFAGSIGRTDLPGGDTATLLASIRNVLFPFGDDARVYPGHGPATTIGQERRTNPYLVGSVREADPLGAVSEAARIRHSLQTSDLLSPSDRQLDTSNAGDGRRWPGRPARSVCRSRTCRWCSTGRRLRGGLPLRSAGSAGGTRARRRG